MSAMVADEPGLAARRMARVLTARPPDGMARFVSGLSGTDEELLRRMLGDLPGPEGGGSGGLQMHLTVYLPLLMPLLAAHGLAAGRAAGVVCGPGDLARALVPRDGDEPDAFQG